MKGRKPLDVLSAAFRYLLAVLALFLMFPMIMGVVGLLFEEGDSGTVAPVSQELLTGLILVAAALGALTLWFAGTFDESAFYALLEKTSA